MSYLIFDIETVPDPTMWKPGGGDPGADGKKRRAKKSDSFAPLYAHRPIAIGYVLLTDELQVANMGCAGTMSFGDDERALLNAWNQFAAARHTLVSFNGRGFDMPVLTLRALRWGVQQGWYGGEYRGRYKEEHLDLFDQLTEFGAVGREGFSLDTFSQIIGLPAKGGFDGSKVAGAFAAGEAAKIEAYCVVDVVKTSFLLMRYLLMRGRIDLPNYQVAANRLLAQCDASGIQVTKGVDRSRLLFEG